MWPQNCHSTNVSRSMTQSTPNAPVSRTLEWVSLALALLTMVATSVLAYGSWNTYSRQTEQLEITRRVATGSEGLLSALKDAETAQRGYLLTGREEYLEPYRQALIQIPRIMD